MRARHGLSGVQFRDVMLLEGGEGLAGRSLILIRRVASGLTESEFEALNFTVLVNSWIADWLLRMSPILWTQQYLITNYLIQVLASILRFKLFVIV